jgi:hypothetical protein
VMMVTRTRLLASPAMMTSRPLQATSQRGSVIPDHDDKPATSGHESTWIRPRWPWREQLLHSRPRLVMLEPQHPLSSQPPNMLYIHVNVD